MRKLTAAIIFCIASIAAFACPVCERNQAGIVQSAAHGSNPESRWDYVIVIAVLIIVVCTLFYSVKWLIKPNESGSGHIKNSILIKQ